MSDCVSTQELPETPVSGASLDQSGVTEGDPSLRINFSEQEEDVSSIQGDGLTPSSKYNDQQKRPLDEQESIATEEGCTEELASPPGGCCAPTEELNNPNSPESGEVSEEENHGGGVASSDKGFQSIPLGNVGDLENQDEFFDDDRSETPLQDEQETELGDKASEFLNADDGGGSEYISTGVRLKEMVIASQQPDQNTDGELSDDDKTSQGVVDNDTENGTEMEKSSYLLSKDSVEKKSTITDDYGELDYEEEEADDSLDKGKSAEERKKKEKTGSQDVISANDLPSLEEGEDGEDREHTEETVKAKRRKAEKKAESGEQEEGEEPEEGEHSTDGELDDDDDCEEGEIREPGQKHTFVRPMCRFYTRGNCTWGSNCRFLHPGINDKGNYSMIDPSFPPGPPGMMGPMMGPSIRGPLPPPPGPPGPWIHERLGKRILPRRPPEIEADVPLPAAPLPPPPTVAEAATESAWERGLRHAKEIRKMAKRKETDPAFEDKKDTDVEEDREAAPPPVAPPISAPLPPPRDPYYDDLPGRFEDDGFYSRPPVPLPPPDAWPFRPPPVDPFEMRWPRPLDFPPPPHPDFRIPERERALRERRFSPPPRFEPGRPPEDRYNRYDKFNRYEPRYYRDGPSREPLPAPPTDIPLRGRGEEWKDPWLRGRSPKRKRASSSRSGSRGRRRSRSKGSYSSFSSSSYSSKSRSRSSSYSSSYSKSSRSQSSYSSRSSSRSRSSSARKPLPVATTLGQSIMEKHGKAGDGPRSVINKVPPSAIGSVPLPPSDKSSASSASQASKAIPPSPAASVPRPTAAVQPESTRQPPQALPAPQPPSKVVIPGANVPIGAKPIVVPGRPALQQVGRGVAAAFSEKDDEQYEVPVASGRSQLPPLSSLAIPEKAPMSTAQTSDRSKGPPSERPVEKNSSGGAAERGGPGKVQPQPEESRGRSRELAPGTTSKVTVTPRQPASADKPPGRASQPLPGKDLPKTLHPGPSGDRGSGRSHAPDGDRPSARMPVNAEKAPVKPPFPDKDRSGNVRGPPSQNTGKAGPRPGEGYVNRGVNDSRGGPVPMDRATKVDPSLKRRDRIRSSSTESSRSRSTSGSMSRSSSSASRDSEHLYSDIASPISSASSMSPIRSPVAKPRQVEKGRVPAAKNPSAPRLPPPPQAMSLQHGGSQRPDGYRGDLRGRMSSSSRPQQPLSSHMPSSRGGGGGRDMREGSGREPGGREPGGREPGGRDIGGREPSGRDIGGREPGGRDVGGREPGGRDVGGREPGGRDIGGRDIGGRDVGGRSGGSAGGPGGHPREMGMGDSRMRASVSMPFPPHASQSNQPSSRNQDLHSSQKGNIKLTLKQQANKPSSQPPPAASGRKRLVSPGDRLSPPGKVIRRDPEQKAPVKIPIPRHDKMPRPSSSPQRRRSDTGHFPPTSPPVNKGPFSVSKQTPSKSQSVAHAGGGGGGGGSNAKRKGAVSRREELLMQLQAVEEAIAKKRSKMQ